MALRPKKASVTIGDFPGYMNNVDSHDIPPGGASVQVNLQSREPGNIQTRRGFIPVSFGNTTLVSLAPDS